jgi:hypothetical protein
METSPPDRYDKRMNHDQIQLMLAFFESVNVHRDASIPSAQLAIDSLTAIAFDAIVTIEKIKREND